MTHYNVWFSLKRGIPEHEGIEVVRGFLADISSAGDARSFLILKNTADGARTKLPHYQAIVEFVDQAALASAMKNQAMRGIHSGAHGRVIAAVSEFHVEIFSRIESLVPTGAFDYSCDV